MLPENFTDTPYPVQKSKLGRNISGYLEQLKRSEIENPKKLTLATLERMRTWNRVLAEWRNEVKKKSSRSSGKFTESSRLEEND
jgi:hypothetical protein